MDSSQLIDSLISTHQRTLLDMTFYGDKASRDKYSAFVATSITPRLPADK